MEHVIKNMYRLCKHYSHRTKASQPPNSHQRRGSFFYYITYAMRKHIKLRCSNESNIGSSQSSMCHPWCDVALKTSMTWLELILGQNYVERFDERTRRGDHHHRGSPQSDECECGVCVCVCGLFVALNPHNQTLNENSICGIYCGYYDDLKKEILFGGRIYTQSDPSLSHSFDRSI